MGFPLNNYTMLWAATRHMKNYNDFFYTALKQEAFRIRKDLSKFKLFGYILYDQQSSFRFKDFLKNNFETLDRVSGRNFLFFSVVNNYPSKKVENNIYLNDFYRSIHHLEEDSEITVYTIAKFLGVHYGDLPVLVLTESLDSNKGIVIRTDQSCIIHQLSLISDFADGKGPRDDFKSEKFHRLLGEIDLLGGAYPMHDQFSLAETITGVQAVNILESKNVGQTEKDFAKAQKKQFLKELTELVLRYKKMDLFDEKFEQLCDMLLCYVALFNQSKDSIPQLDEHCEQESKIVFNTFQRSYPIFEEILKEHTEEVDYSPLVISLGKVLEIELNHSIVQWIRQHLGVEMPTYFNRYVQNGDFRFRPAEYDATGWEIDFNRRDENQRYFAPPIGETVHTAQTLFSRNLKPENLTAPADFLKFVNRIRINRNQAAHPPIVPRRYFVNTQNFFDRIFFQPNDGSTTYIQQLNELKRRLRGDD